MVTYEADLRMPSLSALERWMFTVITDPGGVAAGAETAACESRNIESASPSRVVHETSEWRAEDRLHVYWNAYVVRLQTCLRAEFPTLHSTLGDEAFDEFAAGYVQAHPSASYTLGRFGAQLSEYLAATRPRRVTNEPDWADFLIDLAAFEWTLSEVFDGPGIEQTPSLAVPNLAELSPDELLRLRFETAPCLRLRMYRFPVHAFHAETRSERAPAMPPAQSTYLAVTRRNFVVQHYELGEAEHRVLECLTSGCTLSDSLASLNAEAGDAAMQLAEWFQRWSHAGFFTRILL